LLSAGLATLYESEKPRLLRCQVAAVTARLGMHARLGRAVGPFVVTARRLHRPGCPWTGQDGGDADLCTDAAAALLAGRAPCRTCLAWPP
jgi:hypothetical protein